MFYRGGKTAIAIMFTGFLGFLLEINSCGIYTAQMALNPPFNQHKTVIDLTFSGYNTEGYFSGYILWYKKAGVDDNYYVCVYKESTSIPTITQKVIDDWDTDWVAMNDYRSDTENPRIVFNVNIKDLKPLDSNKNFVDLNKEDGDYFYFAVSSYGDDGEESEKIEFGKWPSEI